MDAHTIPTNQVVGRFDREPPDGGTSVSELIEQITGFVRRQLPLFIFVLSSSILLGAVYLLTAPAKYTSHAMLLIDSSKLRVLQQQQGPIGDVPVDTAQVETQVEILKSENIGLSVIKDLHLTDDPQFVGTGAGGLRAIFNLFGPSEPRSEFRQTRRALQAFLSSRSISRVGRTYVLDIGFVSLDPNRAAAIANAIADAYIVDQLESKYQATRRASVWLQDRIKELRTQASVADRAVQDYKEKNNIVDVGGGSNGPNGSRLLGEQQLGELNTQLGTARAATAEAKARLDRIDDVMKREVPDASVADSLHSEVINHLRGTYLELAAKEAIWSKRYGVDHLAAVNLRTQMVELRRAIFDELGRIAASYKSDYEISKAREESLEQSLSGLVSEAQSTNRDRLGLRELESTAQVYHTIYDNFLQRYMEAIQQQSFPITEARVISAAAPPTSKSSPITLVVLGIAVVFGILVSFAFAIMREAVDRVFRTTRQVESALQTNCLAVFPLLQAPEMKGKATTQKKNKGPSDVSFDVKKKLAAAQSSGSAQLSSFGGGAGLNVESSAKAQFEGPADRARTKDAEHPSLGKPASTKPDFMRHVVDEPLSAFAEAFRSIKVAADISSAIKENKVIGITSTIPREGKSTVSCNFAELIADAGKRVILVDGDLRNPTLTRSLAPSAKVGLIEVLGGKLTFEEAIYSDSKTNLAFLPAVIESRLAHTNEILASDAFESLIRSLRKSYDYVVIDFPPIAPVVDVRAVASVVDSFIYVVEWGRTSMNLVQHQLFGAPEIQERLLGVVLNKANVKVLERYESYYGRNYYRKYYGRYGYTS